MVRKMSLEYSLLIVDLRYFDLMGIEPVFGKKAPHTLQFSRWASPTYTLEGCPPATRAEACRDGAELPYKKCRHTNCAPSSDRWRLGALLGLAPRAASY